MPDLVLGESLEVLIDNRGKNPPFVSSGIPVVSAKHVKGGNLILDDVRFVSPETWESWMPQKVRLHDVVLTSEAPLGRVALIRNDDPIVLAQRVYGLRGKRGVLDSRFLFYALQSEKVQNDLLSRATGTTVHGIRQPELLKVRIPAPPYAEQRRVASLLGALDDKIVVNDRIAVTARALGQAHFAAALEDGAQGVDLSEVVSVLVRGIAPKYSEDVTAVTVINQKCVRNGRVNLESARKALREKVREPKFLRRYDVLVNSTGVGTLGRVAIWDRAGEATADSHVTIVRFDPDKVDPLCAGMAMLRAQQDIELLGEGSTGQTELSRKQLNAYRITIPSNEVMRSLRPQLDALEARGKAALDESTALAALRDTLLPKLMSGEIRVRDAEKAVEDAV